jgi:hypothetical protein
MKDKIFIIRKVVDHQIACVFPCLSSRCRNDVVLSNMPDIGSVILCPACSAPHFVGSGKARWPEFAERSVSLMREDHETAKKTP